MSVKVLPILMETWASALKRGIVPTGEPQYRKVLLLLPMGRREVQNCPVLPHLEPLYLGREILRPGDLSC